MKCLFYRALSALHSAQTGCLYLTLEPLALPYAWWSLAWSLNNAPLSMVYDGLDPEAAYEVRVVYFQWEYRNTIQLMANDTEGLGTLRH